MFAELKGFFIKELEFDFVGMVLRKTTNKLQVVIKSPRANFIIGEQGKGIRALQAAITQKFSFPPNYVDLFVLPIRHAALSATARANMLRLHLEYGCTVRRQAHLFPKLFSFSE